MLCNKTNLNSLRKFFKYLPKINNNYIRLLTENQKVEFHSKALKYLQQNTRRCSSCGNGPFNKLLGQSMGTAANVRKKKANSTVTRLRHSLLSDSDEIFEEAVALSK